jgi:histidinol-phosphate/aromatic aminotransferase/cobyric acid decarboxylase-like protein
VVVSVPFADTGNVPRELTTEFLDRCKQLGVPVLVDCAFFGICGNIDFDFSHPAITEICFSLSKTFPVNLLRIGIRFSKEDDNDSLLVYHRSQYVNRLGAAVGLALIQNQSPDSTYIKWRLQQIKFCSEMQLEASDTVIFGIDRNHRYDQYNRGSVDTNRICFSRHFETGLLPHVQPRV